MKKHLCISIVLLFISNVYGLDGKELDPLHQLLDQIEQAWQQHDINSLTGMYSDKAFLLISNTPKGALVLNRAQALKSISSYWTQVKRINS